MKDVEARLHEENRAIYLPAISETFARFAHSGRLEGQYAFDAQDLNYLDPRSSLFHYPYGLYSAGQAAPERVGAPPKPDIVSQRDRDATIMLGDSGGFQVQTGAIEWRSSTPLRMLRWMEAVTDWSMILDFPTGGIGAGAMPAHMMRLEREGHDLRALNGANRLGLPYNACLLQTRLNNDFFVANRQPGATRLLNVLQGRNERESKTWYEAVKHYPFEGWAFAGWHQNTFSLLLARLLDMRDDGILERVDWLHVLGVATLPLGVLFTTVQRAVRRHINPRFQISFDSASPYTVAVNNQIVTGSLLGPGGWALQNSLLSSFGPEYDDATIYQASYDKLENKSDARVAHTALSKQVRIGQLRKADGRISKDGYNLLMNHNVEAYLDGHWQADTAMFDEVARDDLLVPLPVKTIAAMIDLVFDGGSGIISGPIDPRKSIREWKPYLDALRGL